MTLSGLWNRVDDADSHIIRDSVRHVVANWSLCGIALQAIKPANMR